MLAVQHVRGRYASEGVFTVTRDLANDSADTVDRLIAQPWSNGRVGTFGCSYLGESQIALARIVIPHTAPSSLKGLVAQSAACEAVTATLGYSRGVF